MPKQAPPTRFTGSPVTFTLQAGTILSRLHRSSFGGADFNPTASDVLFGGGRFDSTPLDPYEYLYAGESHVTAIAEGLLRDVAADDRGYRFLPKRVWSGRRVSCIETVAELQLVSLRSGQDLGAIGADTWLTTSDPDDYPQTRAWAHWLRNECPSAAGLAWLSKREPGATSYVFFGDRCPAVFTLGAPPIPGGCDFDQVDGFNWLRNQLALYRVAIKG